MKAYLNKLCKQGVITSNDIAELSEKLSNANRNGTIKVSKITGSLHPMVSGSYIYTVGMMLEIKRVGKPKVTKLVTKKKK